MTRYEYVSNANIRRTTEDNPILPRRKAKRYDYTRRIDRDPILETDDSGSMRIALETLEDCLFAMGMARAVSRILACLFLYGGISQLDIGELTRMDASQVSKAVPKMVKQGLVEKLTPQDESGHPYGFLRLTVSTEDIMTEIIGRLMEGAERIRYLEDMVRKVKEDD
jgi:DNA-binding MarR family transcriptional regulator